MFVYLPTLFKKCFAHLVANAKRRREARYAEREARRRQARFVHLQLEDLEERIVPDAYVFAVDGNPSVGAYTVGANWTNLTKGGAGKVPGAADTADIPSGAVCTLDSGTDQSIAGLTVEGNLTTKSQLTVAPGGSGSGTTSVAAGGLLDVTTPDMSGYNSTLETSVLTTASSGATNLSIDDGAAVDVDSSGSLMGNTSLTGHLTAKNINASSGANVALGGTGVISGNGQLDAEIQSVIDFASGSTWTILPGNPAGSALKAGNFTVDGTLLDDTNIEPFGDLTLDPGGTIGGGA